MGICLGVIIIMAGVILFALVDAIGLEGVLTIIIFWLVLRGVDSLLEVFLMLPLGIRITILLLSAMLISTIFFWWKRTTLRKTAVTIFVILTGISLLINLVGLIVYAGKTRFDTWKEYQTQNLALQEYLSMVIFPSVMVSPQEGILQFYIFNSSAQEVNVHLYFRAREWGIGKDYKCQGKRDCQLNLSLPPTIVKIPTVEWTFGLVIIPKVQLPTGKFYDYSCHLFFKPVGENTLYQNWGREYNFLTQEVLELKNPVGTLE